MNLKLQDRLEGMAPDWPESPAAVAARTAAGQRRRLPEDNAELFAALLAMEQGELVRLLAVCVAVTVDVVTPRATPHQPGAELAQAVGLDMAHGGSRPQKALPARSEGRDSASRGRVRPRASTGWRSSRRPTLPARRNGWPMARAGCPHLQNQTRPAGTPGCQADASKRCRGNGG